MWTFVNWNMDLNLGKPSFSTHCSLKICSQLQGKWHNHDAKQSRCPNFFSSGPTNCILIHFWWNEETFFSCPSFPTLFQVNRRGVFNSLCLRKSLNGELCFSYNAILCTCNKHHCWSYFWVAFHNKFRYHLNTSACTFWNIGRV